MIDEIKIDMTVKEDSKEKAVLYKKENWVTWANHDEIPFGVTKVLEKLREGQDVTINLKSDWFTAENDPQKLREKYQIPEGVGLEVDLKLYTIV